MRYDRCLECGSGVVYISTSVYHYYCNTTSVYHYYCNSCGWWMYADVYDKMIREISQMALEEALGEV